MTCFVQDPAIAAAWPVIQNAKCLKQISPLRENAGESHGVDVFRTGDTSQQVLDFMLTGWRDQLGKAYIQVGIQKGFHQMLGQGKADPDLVFRDLAA